MNQNRTRRSVLQDWAMRCSLMQQTVLQGIIRGPDNIPKYHPVKPILRWYRRCLLLSAFDGEVIDNPYDHRGGSFAGPSIPEMELLHSKDWRVDMTHLVDKFMVTMDEMPIHFWLHMAHAIEIMGYKHDNGEIAIWWNNLYVRMVHAMHLYPEPCEEMDKRLGDRIGDWRERSDPAIDKMRTTVRPPLGGKALNYDVSQTMNNRGEKVYFVEGYDGLQVLDQSSTPRMRIMKKRDNGYSLQFSHYRSGNGEMTEHQWVDVRIVDEQGHLIDYEMRRG